MKKTAALLIVVLLALPLAGCSGLELPPEIDPEGVLRLVAALVKTFACDGEAVPECAARAADQLLSDVPEIPAELRAWIVGLIEAALREGWQDATLDGTRYVWDEYGDPAEGPGPAVRMAMMNQGVEGGVYDPAGAVAGEVAKL